METIVAAVVVTVIVVVAVVVVVVVAILFLFLRAQGAFTQSVGLRPPLRSRWGYERAPPGHVGRQVVSNMQYVRSGFGR